MKKGISKEMEIREVMKWQLLIAGAVDAAIKGVVLQIRCTSSMQIRCA